MTAPAQEARPSGIVTFLFTDIEGSTRRWEADPDAMRDALSAHDDVLRTAIEAHGGWLFKHTGDGVCAAFSSPHGAVDAAIEAQRALGLPVRMGVATGEAELRGDDYFGPALNRAARVMAAGHGGQVLLVAATAGLLTDVALVDLGPRRLRDLSEPVGVFQLQADGLRVDFPPLATLDVAPGNLRPQATSFVGRDAEVAELVDAVRHTALVTLTGVGGVGKTRLALQVAAELVAEFPDGVWMIELAALDDPGAVPDAVATVLGITQQPGLTVAESVAATLAGRLRLLVLDNCEHVLDAAADLIEAILARSSTVKVLATSREGLRVGDEHLWPVPSLDVRAGAGSACVTLFVDRARAVVPGFSLTGADDTEAIVEICHRLDGIPLAIELAASRLTSMSPTELRDRLDDRFRLLSGSRRGLERHQTLRHAVQWSYDLLEPAERDLLDRCSVFAGGFDLAAAVALGGKGELDEYTVLDLLDALVRKSLLNAEASSGRTRYSMLETIRQFAEEQLAAVGEGDAARTLHARYFAGCRADVSALWNSAEQRSAYDWLDRELPNLRTGFRWSADQGDLDTAAAIAVTAASGECAMVYEPATWCEELLEPARTAESLRLPELYIGASACTLVGRVDDGIRYAEAALALVDDHRYRGEWNPDWRGIAGSRLNYSGRPELVVDVCRAELERTGNPFTIAGCVLVFGLHFSGRDDEARAAAAQLVDGSGALTNPMTLGQALLGYGWVYAETDPTTARDALRRGLEVARDSGNRSNETHTLLALARLEHGLGDAEEALHLLGAAIGSYHDAGAVTSVLTPLAILVTILDRLGRYERAAVIAGYNDRVSGIAFPDQDQAVVHLGEVLGTDRFKALVDTGAAMEPASLIRLALDEIEQALASDVVAHEGDGLAVHEA